MASLQEQARQLEELNEEFLGESRRYVDLVSICRSNYLRGAKLTCHSMVKLAAGGSPPKSPSVKA